MPFWMHQLAIYNNITLIRKDLYELKCRHGKDKFEKARKLAEVTPMSIRHILEIYESINATS